jgi:ADP-dependent NAD(P)H-hydrate dehydratase / NAD(P)H-hydrate epimerase
MDSTALFRIAQIRAIEQAGIASLPSYTLMQRAGAAVAAVAESMLNDDVYEKRILILAGPGNNGGDGCEAASVLAKQGAKIFIHCIATSDPLPPDPVTAFEHAVENECELILEEDIDFPTYDLVIDALFGIGLSQPIKAPLHDLIAYLNRTSALHHLPVLAVDVPSGCDADTGCVVRPDGIAVRADKTITFIANKIGLHTAYGRDYAGQVEVDTLDLPENLFSSPYAELNHPSLFSTAIKKRNHATHKGSYGDVKIIGGARGMAGAIILASRMALHAGAGRTYAVFLDDVPAYDSTHPEIMCRAADTCDLTANCLVIGPGLGVSRAAHDVLSKVLSTKTALILDADALNLIAVEAGLQEKLKTRTAPCILTPHSLEAARLLNQSVELVQADRIAAAQTLSAQWNCVVILKGSGSVIAHADGRVVINSTGNPALATAGTGDVLAGCCGALLAQTQVSAWEAALASTWLHGKAADNLAATMFANGEHLIGMTASELIPAIRKELNHLII